MKGLKKIVGVLSIIVCVLFLSPNEVHAKADFDSLLTNGKLVINGVEPKSTIEASDRFGRHFYLLGKYDYTIPEGACDDTFKTCFIVYRNGMEGQEDKEVQVEYKYDKSIKKVADNLVSKMGDKRTFELTDMELINYLLYKNEESSLANFSLEFRKAIGYKNFELDVRGGDNNRFYTENIGIGEFIYNGTLYAYEDGIGVSAKHIIYVDSNASDIKAAIKKRITDTFGNVDVQVTDGLTISSFLEEEKNNAMKEYDESQMLQGQYSSREEYAEKHMNENYYNDDANYHFITSDSILENYYIVKVNGEEYSFAAIKDSSKIKNNEKYKTIDVNSDVEINLDGSRIPLDTLIKVSRLTSGEEYEKLIKILNTTDVEMFDLKLFSKSMDNYITKLEDGTFEVRLPIKDSLKDKDLTVYYVDENGKKIEYKVTKKDGYAIFNTDHFSVYSLTVKNSSNKTIVENPKTSDNILVYILLATISLCGLSIMMLHLKKKSN